MVHCPGATHQVADTLYPISTDEEDSSRLESPIPVLALFVAEENEHPVGEYAEVCKLCVQLVCLLEVKKSTEEERKYSSSPLKSSSRNRRPTSIARRLLQRWGTLRLCSIATDRACWRAVRRLMGLSRRWRPSVYVQKCYTSRNIRALQDTLEDHGCMSP